jgi:predicted TIM-barrel fold metal-dependent hydrolase
MKIQARRSIVLFVTLSISASISACAHKAGTKRTTGKTQAADIRQLQLKHWQPRSQLKVKRTLVTKPAFPAVDVHNHLQSAKDVPALIKVLDQMGVRAVVNLDGYWGQRLEKNLARFDRKYPGRILTFAQIDFEGIDKPNWARNAEKQLRQSFQAGAKGLKLHKSLGLGIRYDGGRLMPIDDAKLDPIWRLCAELKRPVVIHSADPAAFFTPLDAKNERWHELNENPSWLFFGKDYPSHSELLKQRNRVIAKHPQTTFIGAHMGNHPEDLAQVGKWLDAYPNFHVDIDARINELGRQPYTARRFFLKYQNRILFGTDAFPRAQVYQLYYRFLETDDEYWDTAPANGRQGFWAVYGLYLPKDVLEKLYFKNAARILGLAPQ